MERRDFLRVAGWSLVALSAIKTVLSVISAGCGKENEKKVQAAGEVLEFTGEQLIVYLPRLAAQVIGVALDLLGKALQIVYETLAGGTDTHPLRLLRNNVNMC